MRRSRGLLIGIAIVIIMVALGISYCLLQRQTHVSSPYVTERVGRGDIVRVVAAIGQLQPLESVEVSTQISGLITASPVDFNASVRKGDLLVQIDPSTYEQTLRQAEATLVSAQAMYIFNEANTRRLKSLLDEDLVTQQDYDQAAALQQQSLATLQVRKAAVENAQVDLRRCRILSPIDGVVIFKQAEVGKTVAASFSAPTLFVIARDLSKMRIVASINEADISMVRAGQLVQFTVDAIPDRTFEGTVTQVRVPYTPTEKEQAGASQQSKSIASFDGIVEVNNIDLALTPGLTANVDIIVDRRKNVIRVPNSALRVQIADSAATKIAADIRKKQPATTVYKLTGGGDQPILKPVAVRTGLSDGIMSEVSSGLDVGEVVVLGANVESSRKGLDIF